ncbi:MAG: hypothetical protein QNJ90_07530 [Planctomycetota bacterium]|nr:hypothetical protein [Planctomycetota bacterium]
MNGKLTLSFTVATFVAAIGMLFFLSEVRNRLKVVERELDTRAVVETPARPKQPAPSADESDLLKSQDVHKKLNWIMQKLEELDTRVYEGVVDLESTMFQLKRQTDRVHVVTKRILEGLRKSGDFEGFESSLPEPKKPLTIEQRKEFKAEAARWGIKVEEGKVTARGLLNGAQDKAYPIEYFMTRFPDAGHETLVHLIGTAKIEEFAEPPFPNLAGLCTAFYKAMLAAGFEQGEGSHFERPPEGPDDVPPWILASGDTVYVYVRYEEEGETKLARATDWVIDPATKSVLPEDCFKFTGSLRVEHRETGDELLLAEARGFLMSVYPDRAAMIEVALDSARANNYLYNWSRLPKHDGSKPFYVDLIFTKTPLEK